MSKGDILIIDDEAKLRGLMARILGLEGYTVTEATDVRTALKILDKQDFHLVLCDVKLPDGNGIDLTEKIKTDHPATEVIVLTAFGSIKDGVKAIKNGAFDYLTKGDDNERLIPLADRAVEKAKLRRQVQELEKKVQKKFGFEKILGNSPAILEAVNMARKVAATDTTVLLLGETGTGKELFAQAIHHEGKRKDQPFVAINCSTFSRELLESELFGYKAGAFTGAAKDKKGLFEEANRGTLFLDEIGELDTELQAKLLRVLENHTFIKVGDTKTTSVDVRIIAATNRDLQKESADNHFRSDLYYRLSVFTIHLPSLRDRKKDIDLLADFFIKDSAIKVGKPITGMTVEVKDKLRNHAWKGNIRELRNIIERTVILSAGNMLTIDDLPFDIRMEDTSTDSGSTFDLEKVEKDYIRKVLHYTKGNKTEAARLLNIALATLYRKIEQYKIS